MCPKALQWAAQQRQQGAKPRKKEKKTKKRESSQKEGNSGQNNQETDKQQDQKTQIVATCPIGSQTYIQGHITRRPEGGKKH